MTLQLDDYRFGLISDRLTSEVIRDLWLAVATIRNGTVTSVGLSAPSIFSVSGSPVTGSGTLALSLATQSANRVWAGPSSGAASTPSFRALVAADLPVATVRVATTTPVTVTAAEAAAGAFIICRLVAPGAVAVALPAGVVGYRVTVKDGTGDAGVNNITVTPAAGNIDGAATNVIAANYASRTYVYDGTEWSIV